MGLDMYLIARKNIYQRDWAPAGEPDPVVVKIDDMKITAYEMEAAYWRKHPNLHGYIVREFAGGVDECQEIELDAAQCRQIARAILADALPSTTGFFFGVSERDREETEADANVFNGIAVWLENVDAKEHYEIRRVRYQASW